MSDPKQMLKDPQSLDPVDWESTRELASRMASDMITYLETVRERPPWQPMPAEVKARLDEPLPTGGADLESVYEAFKRDVLPYPTGNIHPRFWGWVMGTGTPTGMLADMLASAMNSHVAGYDQAASILERQVCKWLVELMGFPASSSSLLVSGGTAANLNGLTAALVTKAGFDIREEGVAGGPSLTVYASTQTHSWLVKACEHLGLGRKALRLVPVDASFRIDIDACRQRILADIKDGMRPVCIVGNVGTVNTAAVDDLPHLRALADEFNLWLHLDGAFGALAGWGRYAAEVQGQNLADSLAFDLHKWGYVPYEVGVVITRDPAAQLRAYKPAGDGSPAYLLSAERGISVDATYFADRGMQLSRGFRALKVWMSFKEQGVDRISEAIARNIDQARHLAQRVNQEPRLQLMAPCSLNTVCFRYVPDVGSPEEIDRLNADILVELQERGIAVPSQTILDGRYALRVCNTNHRSRLDDFDTLVTEVLRLGAELSVDDGHANRSLK